MTRPRLSYRPVFLLLGGLLTCLPSGCRSAKAEEEEKPPPAPVQLRGYNNFTLEEWTDLTPGTTQPLPNRVARVSAPVEGRVVSLLHDAQGQPLVEGQSVKKGDVIAQLDASVVRAHRDQLAAAQAELKEQKKQAEYALQLADIDVERNERLTRRDAGGVREKLVSDIQLETAKINRDDARSKLALAERKLETGAKEGPAASPEGKIVFIADQAEADTGNFAVKVRFPNRDLKLRANAVVRLRVLTRPGKACWALPESALMEDQDPPGVVVVEDVEVKKNADGKDEQTGKARRLRAVIGVRDRVLHQVEILRLEDPEKKWQGDLETALIVVEKGQGVQTGDAVRLEEEEEEEPAKPEAKP